MLDSKADCSNDLHPWDHPSLTQPLCGRMDVSPGLSKPHAGACAGCPHAALTASEGVSGATREQGCKLYSAVT